MGKGHERRESTENSRESHWMEQLHIYLGILQYVSGADI